MTLTTLTRTVVAFVPRCGRRVRFTRSPRRPSRTSRTPTSPRFLPAPTWARWQASRRTRAGTCRLHAHRHGVATLGDERTFYHGGSRLFQFDQNGSVKEIGQGVYAVNFAQQVRVDPQDNIWIVDSGSNMLVKFDPDGRALMVLGRKPENIGVRPGPACRRAAGCRLPAQRLRADVAAKRTRRRWRRPRWSAGAPARVVTRHLQPAIRRRLRSRRQHLRRRRVRAQQSHREVHEGRQLRKVVGADRIRPGTVQRNPRHRQRRGRQHIRGRRREQADSGVRRRGHVQVADRQRRHATGDLRLWRRDAVSLQLELERSGEHGERRDLQAVPQRAGRRQVRESGEDAEGVRHGQFTGLPSERVDRR